MPAISGRLIVVRIGSSRRVLKALYYLWVAFPYPLRRLVTAVFITLVLLMKKITGVEYKNGLTPWEKLGTLSFWGVPSIPGAGYRLAIEGEVERPQEFSMDLIMEMPSETRTMRMDCVGGFRNNTVMKGVLFTEMLEQVRPRAGATTAVFYSADGYYTTHSLEDLMQRKAMLVYETNGQPAPHLGFPLRLAIPGKYGYKWAKWVVRIEVISRDMKGYWEKKGLPHRANVGDIF